MNNPRGYFAIGVWHSKTPANIGTLWRSAHVFGAAFVFTVGRRYQLHDRYQRRLRSAAGATPRGDSLKEPSAEPF